MKTINLELQTVHVEPKVIKTDFNWKIGKPIFDCGNDEIAQELGYTSRDEYRREMNSKKGYKKLIKQMGE